MPVSLRLVLGAGCIVAAIAAPVCAQSVYTWKDAKGVTHYSDSPPPASAKQDNVRTVAVPPAPPAVSPVSRTVPAPATTVARGPVAAAAPDPATAKSIADARAAACKQAQDNLAVLQTNAPVGMDQDGDGKNDSVLTADERTKQTANMQAAVTANCQAAAP
jgi:hypothetical protein